MKLTLRDKAILTLVGECNFLSTKQIEENFFSRADRHVALRRIRKLESAGFLSTLAALPNGMKVWRNTALSEALVGCFPSSRRTNLHTLSHDLQAVELRWLLEELGLVKEWFDTRYILGEYLPTDWGMDFRKIDRFSLKPQPYQVPDAILLADGLKRPLKLAVELELNRKSNRRYRRILEFYARKEAPLPWFFVPSRSILKVIHLASAPHRSESAHSCVTLLPELLALKKRAPIYLSDGRETTLEKVFQLNPKIPNGR